MSSTRLIIVWTQLLFVSRTKIRLLRTRKSVKTFAATQYYLLSILKRPELSGRRNSNAQLGKERKTKIWNMSNRRSLYWYPLDSTWHKEIDALEQKTSAQAGTVEAISACHEEYNRAQRRALVFECQRSRDGKLTYQRASCSSNSEYWYIRRCNELLRNRKAYTPRIARVRRT